MRSTIDQVAEFQAALNDPDPKSPAVPRNPVVRLRLIAEELAELAIELGAGGWADDLMQLASRCELDGECRAVDFPNLLKELCDLQYVVDGTYLACGLGALKDASFAEVHRSNMTKVNPPVVINGKVKKGPNYRPADMGQFFAPEKDL